MGGVKTQGAGPGRMKGQTKALASGMERGRGQVREGRGPMSAQQREVPRTPHWFLSWGTGEMLSITKGCVCVHAWGTAGLGLQGAGSSSQQEELGHQGGSARS